MLRKKSTYINILFIFLWLLIWQLFAMLINNSLVLASPVSALLALKNLSASTEFWASIFHSVYYISLGFLLAVIVAIILAALSHKIKFFQEFIAPPLTVFKAVPVASFTILLLISLKQKELLSTVISFMMSLPVLYANILAGLDSVDKKLIEMAQVFKIGRRKKLTYIYVYTVLPFFSTGSKTALGLAWKAGVAAELIGLVTGTIGSQLYYSKLYLMMDYVFAWTIVIVALSLIFERLILWAINLLERRLAK